MDGRTEAARSKGVDDTEPMARTIVMDDAGLRARAGMMDRILLTARSCSPDHPRSPGSQLPGG